MIDINNIDSGMKYFEILYKFRFTHVTAILKIKYLRRYKIFHLKLSLEANKAPSLLLPRQFVYSRKQP